MVKVKNSILTKILSFILVLTIMFGMIPPAVIASAAIDSMATIESLVNGGTMEDSNTVIFADTELVWSEKDTSIGRNSDGWWVGIKVNAPEGMSSEDLKNAKYQSNQGDTWSADKSFWSYKDSSDSATEHYIELWDLVNEQYLNDAFVKGKTVNYEYRFSWDGDSDFEQKITMKIDPETVVLKKYDKTVYPSSSNADIQVITDGIEIKNNKTNIVTAELKNNIELNWIAAGSVHPADGWWVGIDAIAPENADLAKAKYQNKTSDDWGAAKEFNTYKYTENSIQLWGLLNETYLADAIKNSQTVNYTWRFDWDGDDVYEQIVELKLEPHKVTLNDKDGNQVYPYLGTVVSLSGGEVSGTTTNLNVTISEAVIDWSKADLSIGRHSDGWWVGMNITAPEGYTAEQLANAYYNRKVSNSTTESGWGDEQKVLFKDVKDTDTTVQVWMVLNRSLITKYEGLGKNISTQCAFDWDNDGSVDQTITLSVVPSDKIVLNYVAQTGFGFAQSTPEDKYPDTSFTNVASGGESTGNVTYSIVSGNDIAEINEVSGEVTFKEAGTVVVRAVKASDDVYAAATAEYTVKVNKYPQTEFKFANSQATITKGFSEGYYDNFAINGKGEGELTYEIVGDSSVASLDANVEGRVNFHKAGQVTVKATKAADGKNESATIEYVLVIEKSNQQPLVVDSPATITYSKNEQSVLVVDGGNGNGKVSYSIVGSDEYATIDSVTGKITTNKAGGKFIVQVNKEGDDGYNAATPVQVTIAVNHAEQEKVYFEYEEPKAVAYNDNYNLFTNKLLGGSGDGEITYRIIEGFDVASISQEGTLSIFKAGVIKVEATKAGDNCYKEAKETYTLTVNHDTPEFNVKDVTLTYGTTEYKIVPETINTSGKPYVYSIVGENTIGASVDANGKITFTDSTDKVGSVTVQVLHEETEQYAEVAKTVTVTVEYLNTKDKCIVSGEKKNESGWYTGKITVTAPDGYTIGYSNTLSATEWLSSIEYNTLEDMQKKVYLKNADGYMTDAIDLSYIYLDIDAPTELSVSFEESFIEKIIDKVTFGIFDTNPVNVVLSAKDNGSGIDYFEYNIGGKDIKVPASKITKVDDTFTYTFSIKAEYKNKISMKAVDVAGNTSEYADGKIYVIDAKAPKLNVGISYVGSPRDFGDTIYINGEYNFALKITEANFLLSEKPVVTINGVDAGVEWTFDEATGIATSSFNLSGDGKYDVVVDYVDASGNSANRYEKTFYIDTAKPVITVNYTGELVKNNIYKTSRKATITVEEHYFDVDDFTISVNAKDIFGNSVEVDDYSAYLKNVNNWTPVGDNKYFAEIEFDTNAKYSVVYGYKDKARNTTSLTNNFTVDTTSPENLTIELSEPVFAEKLLEVVTFGYYKAEVEVNVSATDTTTGVEYFQLYYTKDGTSTTNKDTFDVKLNAVKDKDDASKYTATYKIPAQARGTVRVEAYDNATNMEECYENQVIVVDNITPKLDVKYTFVAGKYNEFNDIYYTQGETKVTFKITEANFDKAEAPVVTINGVEQSVEWTNTNGTDNWVGEIILSGNGDYVVRATFADRSGNAMATYEKEVHIDAVVPEITVKYEDGTPYQEKDGIKYYPTTQIATITVVEHNFRADDIIATVTAHDINGNLINVEDYAADLSDRANWTEVEKDTYAAQITYSTDAIYTFDIAYADLAGNSAKDYAEDNFVVDTKKATGLSIEYNQSIVDVILNSITYGIYKENVTVTVSADDITSGVEYFEITYTKENNTSDINVDTYTVTLPAVQDEDDASKFTATHTIPAQARGNISVTAFDKAGNKISTNDEKVIVVDDENPTISVEYEFTDNHVVESENIFYTKDTTEVTFTINEANFDLTNKPVVTVNGEEKQVEWVKTKNTDLWVADITLTGNGNYVVKVTFVDASTNEMDTYEKEIRIDNEAPVISAKYDFTDDQYREFNNIYYTKGETKVSFTINESNFLESEAPVVTVNGAPREVTWTSLGNNEWLGEITLEGNGDYVVKATFTDRSTNVMETYEKEVHIDDVAPVITVEYNNNDARNTNNYKENRTATITIVEHNFRAEELNVDVTATDINGKTVKIEDYAAYLKNSDNWTEISEDTYEATITYSTDAIYTFDIAYADLAENIAVDYEKDNFVVDHEAAQNVKIEYSTSLLEKIIEKISFGYYQADVTVTVTATDVTAGVEDFVITYHKKDGSSVLNTETYTTEELTPVQDENDKSVFTATHTIPAQAVGTVSVVVTDNAGNQSGKADDKILVVDNIAPTRDVIFAPERILDGETLLDVYSFAENDNVILYYEEKAVVTFKVNEANFYAEDVIISVNNERVDPASITWSQNGDVWTGSIEIIGDGDYVVTMTYVDRSSNEMTAYTSPKIAIDNTNPVVTVEYDNNDARNENNYKADRIATITVVEHNFRADDIIATVTAHDINGNVINVEDYAAYLSDRANWTEVEKDTYVAQITYSTDAIYTFDIEYTDLIGNQAADYEMDEFVVDHKAAQNITIEYSTSLLEKVIEAITFGFYKPEVIVTITATDVTAGVEDFVITYTQQEDTSATNTATYTTEELAPVQDENDKSIFTVTHTIPAQARGTVSVAVMDNAGNESGKADNKVLVVDDVAPVIDISYETVDKNTLVQFIDAENDDATKGTFAEATNAYYNGNVVAKININEANFFEGADSDTGIVHEVGIKLTKTDDEGNVTVVEYLPEGAVQKYEDAIAEYIVWNTVGDNHSIEIAYTENADYVLEIEYTDYSTNDAEISANDGKDTVKTYVSKTVTVDKIVPVVTVEYGNQNVIHTIDGRDYLDDVQSATITVEEHNFRADDFVATVIAQNIIGEDVEVENFAETLSNDDNWKQDGNVYTIEINYPVDANYTFDYEFKDLAQNAAEAYEADEFTVDTTAPEDLTVSYSTSVFNEILESVTFGYYNAQMTVTITADDETAGVYYFVYSYLKSEGVSDVNAELIDELIQDANENIKHDGKTSTASFTIPKLLLKNDNQFNGTVEFTAYDKAENNTEMIDDERIVVDNIKPTGNITYNEPVQNANNISYYAGNIDATIVINEANFHSEDVVVTVTKDGNSYPVKVQWTDNNVDIHTGTFTLTEDGDYIVKVQYMDRSTNIMEEYTSNRLTIDTKAPTVNVSNIKYNSANKDDKYGFTITADDINMDASSIKPELTAVIRNDDGTFTTKKVSLGQMKTVEAGKTYSFTVDNLKEDAIYSLMCTLKDMSGNAYSKIKLSDGKEYEQVKFSINRDGSTFAASDYTMSTVEKYYVYSIVEDIVLEEVNVDPIENYVVYLNGKKLTEGTDYQTKLSTGSGQWSKRTYTISKDLFKTEDKYSIIIESIDKAETTAYSDVKNLNVSFVVDQTAPVLTISGLETEGKYQVEEQTVTLIPTDDGGRLNSLKVILLDSKGNPLKTENGEDISVRFDMSGEEFLKYLDENDGTVTFTIPEGLEHQVRIICNDCAINTDGTTNEDNELFEKVTVSPNWWVIFFATKPLFYGSIAGVVLLTALICFIIAKKRKKDKEAK